PSIKQAMEILIPNFDQILQKLQSMAQSQGIKIGGTLGGGIGEAFSKTLGMSQSQVDKTVKAGGEPFGLLQSWFDSTKTTQTAKNSIIVPMTADSAQAQAAVDNVVKNILPPLVTVPIVATAVPGWGGSGGGGIKANAGVGASTGGSGGGKSNGAGAGDGNKNNMSKVEAGSASAF